MRIIGGQWGGRRLTVPRGGDVRPTTDRVREALFSILGPIEGARVLDAFCGTGALGLEALSRGADQATFIDTRTATVARNIQRLEARDRAKIERGDVRQVLARLEGPYELIFCDPPYKLADRLGPLLSGLSALLADGGRMILESDTDSPIQTEMKLVDERTYGETMIRIYVRGGSE